MAGAFALALAAAAVTVALVADGGDAVVTRSTSPPSTTADPTPTTTATSASALPPVSTTPPLPAGVTSTMALAMLPAATDPYRAAAQPVTLTAICEGAVLDSAPPSSASYTSLETIKPPLRYLDVAVVVHTTGESAQSSYASLHAMLEMCPSSRLATPTPTGTTTPGQVEVSGAPQAATVAGLPAIQWVQVQTSDTPKTSLRTVVTLVRFQNAIVAVSTDEDSESTSAPELAETSRVAAEQVVKALQAAVAAG